MVKTITIGVTINNNDEVNSSTYSEITLDLDSPFNVALASSFVSDNLVEALGEHTPAEVQIAH